MQDPENCLPLGSLNNPTLSSYKVLYYFGVLAIQALLLPKFQCDSSQKRGFWKGKLTLYGLSFESDYSFHTPLQAKSAMARKALEKLRAPTLPGQCRQNRWNALGRWGGVGLTS